MLNIALLAVTINVENTYMSVSRKRNLQEYEVSCQIIQFCVYWPEGYV